MKYTRTDNGGDTVLAIEGTLDAVTASELRTVVDEIVNEQRKEVTLELTALRLIDSSGVGVIVSLFKRVRAYGGNVPAGDEPGLESTRFFKPDDSVFPFGVHIAVVEVDDRDATW